MNEDLELEQPGGDEDLDQETMQLIAQLLQEGFTEDEIVEAILLAEEGGEIPEEEPAPEPAPEEEEEPEAAKDKGFAAGGFAAKKPKKAATEKKAGTVSDARLKTPKNKLASIIGSLGRFN
jgi:hypothetical protein